MVWEEVNDGEPNRCVVLFRLFLFLVSYLMNALQGHQRVGILLWRLPANYTSIEIRMLRDKSRLKPAWLWAVQIPFLWPWITYRFQPGRYSTLTVKWMGIYGFRVDSDPEPESVCGNVNYFYDFETCSLEDEPHKSWKIKEWSHNWIENSLTKMKGVSEFYEIRQDFWNSSPESEQIRGLATWSGAFHSIRANWLTRFLNIPTYWLEPFRYA